MIQGRIVNIIYIMFFCFLSRTNFLQLQLLELDNRFLFGEKSTHIYRLVKLQFKLGS
jgi:hypothetical protein